MKMLSPSTVVVLLFLLSIAASISTDDIISLSRRSNYSGSLCDHLICPAGYLCSEHTIQTEDGYLLALQRVTSPSEELRLRSHPPVLLQHGLFLVGDSLFLNSKQKSLGFILADHGFDVWIGNVRGTHWSHGHVCLSERDKEFWNWSWEELALYDLKEMIHFIYSITSTKIFFVGHSQMILTMGIHQLNFRSNLGVQILDSVCDGHLECNNLFTSITGKNCCFNNSRVELYLEYEPHPSSSKNLNHLFQMIRKGSFARYDYGMWKNLQVYGSFNPPEFDLSIVPELFPIWVAHGGNDALADITDVQRTLKELHCKEEVIYLENYGHIDFMPSVNAKQDLYDHVIEFFRSWERHSSA